MVKSKDESSVKKLKESQNVKVQENEISIDMSDIKDDLTEYMKDQIDKEVSKSVEKSTKKLIRYKNSVILKKNIIIIILIIICAFLAYNLYKISDISIDIKTNKKSNEQKEEVKQTDEKQKEKKDDEEDVKEKLEDKKKEYKYLIDDIYIGGDSTYIKDFYEGNLTDEIKLYLSLNKVDDEKIESEDGSVYLDEADLKESYDNFFEGKFTAKSFEYNNLKFHYLSSKSLFIADGKFEKAKKDIVKEIINVTDDDNVVITTVEGIIKDNKLFNIINGGEIKKYKSGSLEKYEKSLTKVIYHFIKDDDVYKIDKIEVK